METVTFRTATTADWPAVAELLTQAKLPLVGAEAHLSHFLLAFRGEALVASAGVTGVMVKHSFAPSSSAARTPLAFDVSLGSKCADQQ